MKIAIIFLAGFVMLLGGAIGENRKIDVHCQSTFMHAAG